MAVWRTRLAAVQQAAQDELDGDTSSRSERLLAASRAWRPERGFFALGEVAAWVFLNEEGGRRAKR